MKQLRLMCLMLTMLLVLTACGSNSEVPETTTVPTTAETTEATQVETIMEETSVATEPSEDGGERMVIVDNELCSFTITGMEADSLWGYTVKVQCENKTSDQTLMFAWEDVSIEGYMADPFWAAEVAAGKTSNEEITFFQEDLDEINAGEVDQIEFRLRIYDAEDWSADALVDETHVLYPTGLSAEEIVYPERTQTEGEQVFADTQDYQFVILSVEPDNFWGYTLKCYLENNTDTTLMFSWEDVSVNGLMIDSFWAQEVAAGKRAYGEISFFSTDFEDNGITDVEEIEFKLQITNYEDWLADPLVEEVFTFRP